MTTAMDDSRTTQVSLPGLFADRFEDTQLSYDLRRDGHLPTGAEEYLLGEVWRERRTVKAGKGYRVILDEIGCDEISSLIDFAEAFENAARQGEEYAEARACATAIDRLRAAHARTTTG
jgi:hypothetical protein